MFAVPKSIDKSLERSPRNADNIECFLPDILCKRAWIDSKQAHSEKVARTLAMGKPESKTEMPDFSYPEGFSMVSLRAFETLTEFYRHFTIKEANYVIKN